MLIFDRIEEYVPLHYCASLCSNNDLLLSSVVTTLVSAMASHVQITETDGLCVGVQIQEGSALELKMRTRS